MINQHRIIIPNLGHKLCLLLADYLEDHLVIINKIQSHYRYYNQFYDQGYAQYFLKFD